MYASQCKSRRTTQSGPEDIYKATCKTRSNIARSESVKILRLQAALGESHFYWQYNESYHERHL